MTAHVIEADREELGGLRIVSLLLSEGSDEGPTLVFERGLNPSTEDISHGFDTYSITDEEGNTVYGGIDEVAWDANTLILRFTPEASVQLRLGPLFSIEVVGVSGIVDSARQTLDEILGSVTPESVQ